VLAVLNRKGGAGKTTLTVNVAAVLAETRPVLLVDADAQGSAFRWRGRVEAVHLPDPERLANLLARATPGAVFVVDGPPHDEAANLAAWQAADVVAVPVTPSLLDVDAARPLLEALAQGVRKGLAVLSLVDGRSLARVEVRRVLGGLGVPVAEAELARRVAHVDAVAARRAVTEYEPAGKAAHEVRAVAGELARLLEG